MNSLRATATVIVQRLRDAGFEAYWVGGSVRDLLLGREPGDYDVATSARPQDIEKLFSRVVPIGRQFGVMLVVENGQEVEVATFRAETDYHDGRHPGTISFAEARADAVRRDFTVNGLFYDPIEGKAYDWVGGEADLQDKLLRTIGSADARFAEDHLRLLRAVRLAAQLGFRIEAETGAAIRKHASLIGRVSRERVRDELVKLFRPPHAARGLHLLQTSGLLVEVLPEIEATIGCEQSPEHHPEGTVFQHLLLMLEHLPADAVESLPWAVLLHDVAKPVTFRREPESGAIHFYGHEKIGAEMAEAILDRLKFPRRQAEEIVQSVRYHMQFKDVPEMRKSTLRRLLMRPTFPLELELHRLDCLGSHHDLSIYHALLAEQAELARRPEMLPPLLTGTDLISMGLSPGPGLGALLREIRDKQLQEELKTPEEARAYARRQIHEHPSV